MDVATLVSGTFFSGGLPPCSPLGDYTPLEGEGFFSKIFFLLKNRHMGDFFGRLLQGVIGPPPL